MKRPKTENTDHTLSYLELLRIFN